MQPSWQNQYNLALALVKAKQAKEALPLLASLTAEHATDANLLSDVASTYEAAGKTRSPSILGRKPSPLIPPIPTAILITHGC